MSNLIVGVYKEHNVIQTYARIKRCRYKIRMRNIKITRNKKLCIYKKTSVSKRL